MVKQGSYNVSENASKDASFKSFIFALLVFLSLCIAIYLILMLTRNTAIEENLKASEKSKNNTFLGSKNALAGAKESENSTTAHWRTTTADVSKERILSDPSTKLPVKGFPSTEQSIFYDASSTDNLRDIGKGVEKSADISQSTLNSVESKEGFSNDYQSSNVMATKNDLAGPITPEMFLLTTEAYKSIIEITETDSTKGTTYNFFSNLGLNSVGNPRDNEAISTNEKFQSITESFVTMLQLNEVETIIRSSDNFISSTEINSFESPTVSVSDAVNFDLTTNSAVTITPSKSKSVTLESSVPLSTTDVVKKSKKIKTFANSFQSSTESNQSESPNIAVSDALNFDLATYTTSITSKREESITTGNSIFSLTAEVATGETNSADIITASVIEETTGEIGIPEKICNTAICNRITSKMLYLMDHAADPCVDFYEFACGEQQIDNNFFKQLNFQALLNYTTEVDTKDLHHFNFFYESCVDYERNFKFTERIKLMDYLPNNNLTELFVELILTQSMPLFDIGIDIKKDTPHYVLQITLPGRSSLRASVDGWSVMEQIRKACLNEQSHQIHKLKINLNDIYKSFKDCQNDRFKNVTKSFVENMQWYHKNYSIYNNDNLENLLGLLDRIQSLLPSELEIQETQVRKNYTLFKIEDLYKKYKAVDWKIILESLTFDGMFVANDIEVYFSDYIEKMLNMLQNEYNERELMDILALYSKLQLYENTVIPKNKENREMYCMDLSNQIMPDVTSIIVYKIARNDGKFYKHNLNMKMLFDNLKDQFNESLVKSELDPSFREILQKKLDQIELGLLTTPDYNSTTDNYKKIAISTNNFQKNVISLLRNYRKIIYSLKGKEASAGSFLIKACKPTGFTNLALLKEFFSDEALLSLGRLTYFVDPFYTRPKTFYGSKYIVFHPTIFQRTSMDLPKYIILSKIGLHLSQELAKHFDPIEIRHMNEPVHDNLMKLTNDILLFFANNTYNFKGQSFDFQVNDTLWATEMVADNTAFRLVEDTFNFRNNQSLNLELPWIYKSYPVEKVFFIAAAQEYCEKTTALSFMEAVYQTGRLPPPLKIKNMMSNSKKFSETFDCAEGSLMKLHDIQITQFPYINNQQTSYSVDYEYTMTN